MKRFVRKTRLVLACMNLLGGLFRLLGALVDMASNYSPRRDPESLHKRRDCRRPLSTLLHRQRGSLLAHPHVRKATGVQAAGPSCHDTLAGRTKRSRNTHGDNEMRIPGLDVNANGRRRRRPFVDASFGTAKRRVKSPPLLLARRH